MRVFSHTRSQSLPPQPDDTPQVTFDKPRASSLDAGYPVHEAKHRSTSPARGILKKPSTQSDASRRSSSSSKERSTNGRTRSQSSATPPARRVSAEIHTRPRGYSRADSELDYVAHACGQLPPFPGDDEQPKQRARSSTDPSAPTRSVHWPDDTDGDSKQTHRQRGRTTSPPTRKRYPSLYEQDGDNWELSGQGTVPRLPFQFADWRDVLHDLAHLLRRRRDNIHEQVDLYEFAKRKERECEARARYLEHKAHPPKKEPSTDEKPESMSYAMFSSLLVLNDIRDLWHVGHRDDGTLVYNHRHEWVPA